MELVTGQLHHNDQINTLSQRRQLVVTQQHDYGTVSSLMSAMPSAERASACRRSEFTLKQEEEVVPAVSSWVTSSCWEIQFSHMSGFCCGPMRPQNLLMWPELNHSLLSVDRARRSSVLIFPCWKNSTDQNQHQNTTCARPACVGFWCWFWSVLFWCWSTLVLVYAGAGLRWFFQQGCDHSVQKSSLN